MVCFAKTLAKYEKCIASLTNFPMLQRILYHSKSLGAHLIGHNMPSEFSDVAMNMESPCIYGVDQKLVHVGRKNFGGT